MICKGCGEEYDEEMFPYCPYCLMGNDDNADKEEKNTVKYDSEAREVFFNEVCNNTTGIIVEIEPDVNECENKVGNSNSSIIDRVIISNQLVQTDTSIADIPISEIPFLGNRSKNVLYRNGIFYLSELQAYAKANDISLIRNAGKTVVNEILKAINFVSKKEDNSRPLIEEVFRENKYNLFVAHCKRNNMEYVDQLYDFDFAELFEIKGMGEKKIKDIKEMVEHSKSNKIDMSDVTYDMNCEMDNKIETKRMFSHINYQLFDLDIEFIEGFGLNRRLIEKLKSNGHIKIGDIEGISKTTLIGILGIRDAEKVFAIDGYLNKSLREVFSMKLDELSKRPEFESVLLKVDGMTLQKIGKKYGYTREWARQRVEKVYRRLNPIMIPIVKSFLQEKGYVNVQTISNICDKDIYAKVVINWCQNANVFKYLDFADVLLLPENDIDAIKNEILEFAVDFVGDGISYSDSLEELDLAMKEMNYPYIDSDVFLNFLLNYGYKLYGDFLVKGRQSYGYLCARLIAKYYKKGIKLNDEKELKNLRNLMVQEYGDIDIPVENRAFRTRISEYTVLCGRGAVIAQENIWVEMSLLEEIKDYIDKALEREIYYSELYARFEGMITMMSNIDNYYFLHGVLKLYFSDEYDFSNRDHLTKRGDDLVSGKLSTRLHDFIVSHKDPVDKKKIKSNFPGLTEIVLVNTVLSSKDLFYWDYNLYFSTESLSITEADKKHLVDVISMIMEMNYGYCSANLLYDTVSNRFPDFLNKNRIKTSNTLFFICAKVLGGEFDFRRPHIVKNGQLEKMSVKNVALHLMGYPKIFDYNTYQMVAKRLKWPDVTAGCAFDDIENDYIRISKDTYIKRESFEVNDFIKAQLEKILQVEMKKGFVSMINYMNWETYPVFEYEWNEFLIRTIVENYIPSLRIVEGRFKDRRMERGIIVDCASPVKNYEDLVVSLLRQNKYSEISEDELLSMLVLHNLTYTVIPKELYKGKNIYYKGTKFVVKDK